MSEHLLARTARTKVSSSVHQALHRQKCAVPAHKGNYKDLISVLSPSTQLLQLISYHLYGGNPITSALLAVTILEKSLSVINADRKYRECLICLILMIPLHASFFQALWNSFSTLERKKMVFAESFLSSTPGIKQGNLSERAHSEGDRESCHIQDLRELRKKRNYLITWLEKMDSAQEIRFYIRFW